ncbi:hypothetical protein B0J11DRAFT_414559, partial [Dendryphion nanum]
MTDVSSVKAYADLQPASAFFGAPPPPAYTNGSPALDGTIEEEESSTIKCICGYSDDDGNTVLCEKCDTWQHIVCYYDSAHNVPDVHECTDCLPRSVDAKGATEKQRLRRELHNIGERKVKTKPTTKNHKKRVKDPLGSVQPNGWAVHSNNDLHYSTERKSGSPRDQGPPNKRPKTSHRSSNSVSTVSQAPALVPTSRKRAGSTMHNGHSPVKSPTITDVSVDEFSLEFMNLYRQPEPPSTDCNSYTDIGVANDISTWLNDRDALAEATGGLQPGEVFQRIDQTIVELEALAPIIVKQKDDDQQTTIHGYHPQWQYLTVESFVPQHAFIGEIKGHIGRKNDYFSDPANRWDILRHPEPFVFFPPRLPIYIDTRHEGTILRYIRRSCSPNIEMKILTQGQESGYHFCFIAMHEIEAEEELTISWEVDSEIRQSLQNAVHNGDIRKDGFKKIEPWVANVLSNFGGCACRRGPECLLQRARRPNNSHADSAQPPKTKGRKSKKPHVSPLSTGHATNSRAGSEALHREIIDDENVDGRSTSGSHKSSSRDITPATHFSVDGGDLKMSDREKRKLQQQERLFEQLEYDEQHKSKRGKRNSAGSALNTPGLSTSVRCSPRPTLFEANEDEQRQIGHSEPSPSARTHNGFARKTSGSSTKTNGRSAPKPKPVYVNSSTQTDEDGASAKVTLPCPSLKLRVLKRPISFKHRLLQQACAEREQRERSASVKMESHSPALKEVSSSEPSPVRQSATVDMSTSMDIVVDAASPPASIPEERSPSRDTTPVPTADVAMEEAEEVSTPRPPSPKVEDMPDALPTEPCSETSHPPTQPPPPPWPNSSDPIPSDQKSTTSTTDSNSNSDSNQKPTGLHVQLPTPDLTNPQTSTNSAITPGSVSGSAVAQSPVGFPTAPSPFSPSVTSLVNPGPTRKKLSLSDYTSRRAKLAQTQSTGTS